MSSTGSNTEHGKCADPLSFYDPHASKRFQIDDKILGLRRQIQQLQVARNALLPISSLPNEVLSNVFLTCRRQPSTDRPDMQGLLTLTWVCHRWRDIALSNPSLWTYIGPENFHWAAECLSRSKEAPLEVIFDGPCAPDVRTLLLSQLHRFRRLNVGVGAQRTPGATEALSSALTHPAPALESLTLHQTMGISTVLFSGASPLLHTIEIYGGVITSTLNILPFTALKHLSIMSPDFPVPVISFLQLLPSSLAGLESLRLDDTLSPSPASESLNQHLSRRVYFPNLRKIHVGSSEVSPIAEFFELCSFASLRSSDVVVRTWLDDTGRETALDFLRLLQVSGALEQRPISAWIVHTYEKDDSISFEILPSSDDDRLLTFELKHNLRWRGTVQLFTLLLTHNLRTLRLEIMDMSMEDWSRVFAQFSSLEELTLADELTAQSFIQFISNSTSADISDTDSDTLPFKALRRLRFMGDVGPESNDHSITFCEALKVRRDYGLGLEKIWILRGMFDVDLLKEGVDEIIVQEN
ncbi:hypothetical protein BDN72DRAFT_640983 [Pluteus cervinus]|uniref:Uncharacterized protein n=1 Tax=Pluteus cervinus TaxID=181527 RepID=A0ACD3ATU5_9AGAR|nr:hypothetical protein BDN72DRAFT_640983 [Pluteus cervinus]